MANAGCINAIGFDGTYLRTLQCLDSSNIGVGVQYTAPNPLDDKRFDYITYTDKCGCQCCLTDENEILIYATQGVIKNFTLTNNEDDETVDIIRNDIFGSNWLKTVVRYKTGSYPTGIEDGTLAVEETIKNQYSSDAFQVSGLEDGTTYYFTAFAVDLDGTIINIQSMNITPEFRLPGIYQEVEYIQSSGTNCGLNTGITPHDTSFFEIEFKMTPTTLKTYGGNYFYGTNSSGAWNSFEYTSSSSSYWNVGSSTLIGTLSPNLSTGTDYIFDCKYNGNNGGTLTVSGTYSKSVSYSGSTGTKPLYFFCQGDDLACQSAEKLYYLKIYTGTSENTKTLVRDFIPCYRKSDGVIGMRDRVGKQFYTNAGSGTFTKGSDVNVKRKDFQEVEYIEGNGTQWVDIGIIPTQATKSQIKFRNLGITGNTIFGANSNPNTAYRFFNYEGNIYFDFNYGSGHGRINGSICSPNIDYEFEIGNYYVKNVGASSNLISGTAFSSYTGDTTLCLNYQIDGNQISSNRWYYIKIWQGDTMVRNMIPCYRKSDGVIGLYDDINKRFYTNNGTGTFTRGPIVDPVAWQPGQNTILYCPLENDINDYSGNHTMTLNDTSYGTVAKDSSGFYHFTGGYISSENYTGPTQGTIAAWVKRETKTTGDTTLQRGLTNTYKNGSPFYNMAFEFNRSWYTAVGTGSTTYFRNIGASALGERELRVMTYGPGEGGKMYKNGVLVDSFSDNNNLWQYNGPTLIGGSNYNSGTQYFKGYMSKVIMEDTIWSYHNVISHYETTKNNYSS